MTDRPPAGLRRLLAWVLPAGPIRDGLLGDLDELYAEHARLGPIAGGLWYGRQVLSVLVHYRLRPLLRSGGPGEGAGMVDALGRDVRYSVRTLRRRPTYLVLTVLTLALGVGGTAAVYGIARALLFAPLPYAHEDEIGVFWKKTDWTHEEFSYIRGQVPGFRDVALYRFRDMTLREGDGPAEIVPVVTASTELFDVLGTAPLLGRGFRAGEDTEGAEPVVVLSHGLWQEMGANQSIVGTRLTFDGTSHTVVGVMPRGFWFPSPSVRAFLPEPLDPELQNWNSSLVGRVAPGHEVGEMTVPMAQLTALLDERFDYPAQWDKTVGARITPIRADLVGDMRPAVLATLGAMALILLIASANVTALMLGQLDARSAEFAVRLALGANRRWLVQHLVIEAVLIAATAGVLGGVLARGGFGLLGQTLPLGPWTELLRPDWTVSLTAMVIALAAALCVVLLPTISLWRGDLRHAMNSTRAGRPRLRLGGRVESGLVVAEVALAVLVATGAALLARSVASLYALDPGVRVAGVGVVDVYLGGVENGRTTVEELTRALAALPGVRTAAAAQMLPLRGGGYNMPLTIAGRPELEGASTEFRTVTPGYLETMGMALREGRTITQMDRPETEPVVVINEALARTYFPGVSPVGQLLGDDINRRSTRIVGVVADAAERQLTGEAQPVRYVAFAQLPWVEQQQSLVFRVAPSSDPVALLEAVRQRVAEVAPGVAVRETTTLSRVLDAAVGPARQVLVLLTILSGLALVLGAVGIYGVIAHFAARRRRELAIRIALGLPGARAIADLVGHGALLVVLGIGIGLAAALGATRVLSSLLYEVRAIDARAFALAGAALLLIGLIAAFVPARRAGTADPASILREE